MAQHVSRAGAGGAGPTRGDGQAGGGAKGGKEDVMDAEFEVKS